ncbi:hypothetical protein KIN20_001009 [Parelaphostrongylus tenuis]|uniref:ABC transmembrane type-1 domain-containing protein n=1 Tax=Parelaphostrongylus tenuis TaxID=148309 RepID=A0AAD5QGM6_PARTN|nr:hypothetical protein KIN20_001009 [Parelaphostrongylus tenuis]
MKKIGWLNDAIMSHSTIKDRQLLSRATKLEVYAYSTAASLANEVISGIRTVIAFNAQPFEIQRYERELKTARKLGIRKAFVLALFSAVPLFLMFAAMAISFWYGTTLVLNDAISPGTIFAVFWSVLIGTRRLGDAFPQLGAILNAKIAIADIFAVIDRVNPGETVALVGHSGCGKSTMIGLLLRYYEQSAGVVALDGIPLRDYNIAWLRSTIGVVQQEPVIFAATVSENVR